MNRTLKYAKMTSALLIHFWKKMPVSILENLIVEACKAPWMLRLKFFRECRLLVNNLPLKLVFKGS